MQLLVLPPRQETPVIPGRALQPARTPEQRAALLKWAAMRTGEHPVGFVGSGPYEAFAVITNDRLTAVIFLCNFLNKDAEVSGCGTPGWLTKRVCREFFGFAFQTAQLSRLTAFAARKNKRSRELLEGLGFTLEGVKRKALHGKHDLIMYGLLAKDCRWI